MSPLLVGLGSLVVSLLLAPIVRRRLLAHGIVDRPNARSSHAVPTVRGGGTGFVVTVVLGFGTIAARTRDLDWIAILAGAVLLAGVSFADDVVGLGARIRLFVHALVASILAALVLREPPAGGVVLGALLPLVTLVGAVGYTNAFNFMDGIDGIASMQAIVASFGTAAVLAAGGASMASVTGLGALVVGTAVLGFLPWNFPRARMFMGDVGSATLGYLLSAFVVRGVLEHGLGLLLPLALLHTGFVLDASITFVRRLARGERVTEAHREHFYQRLVRSGLGHPVVTGLYGTASLFSAAASLAIVGRSGAVTYALPLLVVGLWLGVFAFAERRFNRTR